MANTTNWLSISSMSGSSGQTVLTLSAAKNLVGSAKTAEVTAYNPVYNISAKTYVSIEQYSPYITVAPGIIGVPGSGGTYSLNISANCSYTITFPDMVSSYSTSAGTGNTTITFTVPSTTASSTLVGNIVVTDESQTYSTLARIEQYGDGVHITVNPSAVTIPSSGGSVTFTVSADCIYDVYASSGSNFFTISPGSGYTGSTTFTITANGENTGNTDFTGSIVISAPGYQTTVNVTQKQPEIRLIVGYWVTSTTNPTSVLARVNDALPFNYTKMEYPDGTEVTPNANGRYTFPSTGMQYVYYTLNGNNIAQYSFDGINAAQEVYIPKQVTEIAASAFYGTSLTVLSLSDNLQTIGNAAFRNIGSLSSVTIPDSVTSIGNRVFSNDTALTTVYVSSPTPASIGSNVFYGCASDYKIIVPCPYMEAYLSAWSEYSEHITCQDDTTLYFTTDTSNVAGTGETRTITLLNGNLNPNRTGLNLPSDFPQQGAYVVSGNTIYLTYPKNPSSSSRTWTIGIVAQTNDGVSLSTSYNITQDGNIVYSIPYTADTSTVAGSGETRTITLDVSNLIASSITIGIDGATGITYTYNNGVITIVFPEYSGVGTGSSRNITVTITGTTLTGDDALAVIFYTQEYIYAGETRLCVVYYQTYEDYPVKIAYTQDYTKVELTDGTDITNDIYRPEYGGERNDEWAQSGLGYDFGSIGYHSVYITLSSTTIPAYLFTTCRSIRFVDIPNYYTTIGNEAFYSMGGGAVINIGESVTSLQADVFDFSSISKIVFNSITAPSSTTYSFYGIATGGTLFYPCDYGASYSTIFNELLNYNWNIQCYTSTGTPSSSYTYQAYLLGDLSTIDVTGATRTFNVEGILDENATFSYNVSGPTGTSYTYSGDSLTVTVPQCGQNDVNTVTISYTATSYNGLFIGTGVTVITQEKVIPVVGPLTFNIESGGNIYWVSSFATSVDEAYRIDYRLNNGPWTAIWAHRRPEFGDPQGPIAVSAGDVLQFRGDNTAYATNYTAYTYFSASSGCSFSVQGNIMSLISSQYYNDLTGLTSAFTFSKLFYGCTGLTDASGLVLPATTLTDDCYQAMFQDCYNLTAAPALPAPTLTTECYDEMFNNCNSLSSVTCMATDISATDCTLAWLWNVSSSGTFVTPSSTNWTTGDDGIPSGWTRQTP